MKKSLYVDEDPLPAIGSRYAHTIQRKKYPLETGRDEKNT